MARSALRSWARPVILACLVLAMATTGSVVLLAAASNVPACAATRVPVVRIETFNVMSESSSPRASRRLGPLPARMARVASVVRHNQDGRAADIVGLQEVSPFEYDLLRDVLVSYAAFPSSAVSTEPVLWNRRRFALLAAGFVDYPGYDSRGLSATQPAPWVRLRDRRTGHQILVLNQHSVAWNTQAGSDCGGALKRERAAHLFASWARGQRSPVVLLGDWNSAERLRIKGHNFPIARDNALAGNRRRLTYCILGRAGLRESIDLALHRQGVCPSRAPDLHFVDHLYLSHGIRVRDSRRGNGSVLASTSDHRPTYSDVTF